MKLPVPESTYVQRVRYGRHVARRLRAEHLEGVAGPVDEATARVRASGRAWDDAAEPLDTARAGRDAADGTTQRFRLAVASRSVAAVREAPCTAIFPKGVEYCLLAPVDPEVPRYRDLAGRIAEHLPADDPARVEALPALEAGIATCQAASDEVAAARNAVGRARTAPDASDRTLRKTHGLLRARCDQTAESFFPHSHRSSAVMNVPA